MIVPQQPNEPKRDLSEQLPHHVVAICCDCERDQYCMQLSAVASARRPNVLTPPAVSRRAVRASDCRRAPLSLQSTSLFATLERPHPRIALSLSVSAMDSTTTQQRRLRVLARTLEPAPRVLLLRYSSASGDGSLCERALAWL